MNQRSVVTITDDSGYFGAASLKFDHFYIPYSLMFSVIKILKYVTYCPLFFHKSPSLLVK